MRILARTVLAATIALAACSGGGERETPRTSMLAAGDIASCWWRGDEATARLLDAIPEGVVAPLGDLVYQDGTKAQFARCYGPTWGRHRERTRPTPGNHDYRTQGGEGYFGFFGDQAGERGKGWYSYEHDGWHVVALNSEAEIGEGSEQLEWLRRDLRRHRDARCTLAYMHRPRFSSGKHGDSRRVEDAYRVLYDAGADVLLGGHDHMYERFAPQDPRGQPDAARGIRQFVVGTGGAPFYRVGADAPAANSEALNNRVHGVLRLVFLPAGYEWEFVPVRGQRFTDRGRGACH